MSVSFQADPGAIDAAANELSAIAGAVHDVDVAGPFVPVGDALPGSRTGPASIWVSSRLGAAVALLGDHVQDMARSAEQSAESYRSTDQQIGLRFGGMVPR
ncbi:MAG TPA: hypothetical protein VLA97_17055 [Nocardioidaceae bacterium]|jgi:hypothetical protein|nr:hypothetical protein [Nocardioidaceae bacterium]